MPHYPQEEIKPYNESESKAVQVEKMFDNIAPAYDNLNHVLSWGIDKSWRRKAINCLKPYHPQRIMDVATGTGDFATALPLRGESLGDLCRMSTTRSRARATMSAMVVRAR